MANFSWWLIVVTLGLIVIGLLVWVGWLFTRRSEERDVDDLSD